MLPLAHHWSLSLTSRPWASTLSSLCSSFFPGDFFLTEHFFLPHNCWSLQSPFHFMSGRWDPGEATTLNLFHCRLNLVTSCSETCREFLLPRTLHLSFLACFSRLFFPSEIDFIIHPSRMLCQPLLCPITPVWLLCLNSLGQLPLGPALSWSAFPPPRPC